MKKIAYQGIKGSFTEMAIQCALGSSENALECQTFAQVFEALDKGIATMAVIPIENTCIGPIAVNLDLLNRYQVTITSEYTMPIEHCLVCKPEVNDLSEIHYVLSHPKALEQCTRFFDSHTWIKSQVHEDTAGAALEVSQGSHGHSAAIASQRTAELYGLKILKRHLEDDESNRTRFLVLKKGAAQTMESGNKISVLFTVEHMPQALLKALQVLCVDGINLMQIVSRPIREKPFEYLFFVDIVLSKENNFDQIIENLKKKTQTLQVLGRYVAAV